MTCERCKGLFIPVSFVGGDDVVGAWEYDGLKCLNCGHITDPLLKKNRELSAQNDATYHSGSNRGMKPCLGTSPSESQMVRLTSDTSPSHLSRQTFSW